ncbi:MAG: dihydrodipicolinate synthase family protein [Planctomycetaceae bacterium]|nr:dihydrodipicolinate synthase family protein [Planctomycetaceae bacterium]
MNQPAFARVAWPRPLRGIVPPLATPLSGRDQLDHAALERLVERIIQGGVHGLFLLGTTGEAAALSVRLRRELVERVTRQTAGRVPVLVGVSDTSLVEALAAADHAAAVGADAIVATTPYYLPLEQTELLDYFRALHDESPLPLYLYNMPGLTKTWISLEVVRAAMEWPNVHGLKDSSGDLAYFRDISAELHRRPDWSLLVGPEALTVDTLALGGHGCVGGGANVHPQLFARLYDAATRGDDAEVARLQAQLTTLGVIYGDGQYGASAVRGIKCALSILGICDEQMAATFRPATPEQRAATVAALKELQLL